MTNGNKKIYFVSDCHFGIPDPKRSLEREKKLVKWMDNIKADASELFILGDLFDFWFEYKTVIPRGYTRLLGKLAELSDSGVKVHIFTGNHDMWMFSYFAEELGIDIFRKPIETEINGLKMMIGHGDGLGPGDYGYKFIKKVFANKLCQWLFARLHPNFAIGLGLFFSHRSRLARGDKDYHYKGEDKERLLIYTKKILEHKHFDYFIFGHRHFPLNLEIGKTSHYINLGDWIYNYTYAELEGQQLTLKNFNENIETKS